MPHERLQGVFLLRVDLAHARICLKDLFAERILQMRQPTFPGFWLSRDFVDFKDCDVLRTSERVFMDNNIPVLRNQSAHFFQARLFFDFLDLIESV